MEQREYKPVVIKLEQLNKKSGIYQIRNIINNKFYIGSSRDLKRRYMRHVNSLVKNKHHNKHLQRAFNKYGKENFIFEIIEFIEDKDELLKVEQYWLDRFFNKNFCYNENPKAISIGFTDEIRKRMSQNHADVSDSKNYFYGKHFCGEQNHFYGKNTPKKLEKK